MNLNNGLKSGQVRQHIFLFKSGSQRELRQYFRELMSVKSLQGILKIGKLKRLRELLKNLLMRNKKELIGFLLTFKKLKKIELQRSNLLKKWMMTEPI
jgi:hypothetical protein